MLVILTEFVRKVAVLVLGAVTVAFGVGLLSPSITIVLDWSELPH